MSVCDRCLYEGTHSETCGWCSEGEKWMDKYSTPQEEKEKSDGSTASYYELPKGATELQDIISYLDLNAQLGEIIRAVYRYGKVQHSPKLRDAKKIKFYIEAEIARLEKYGEDK